jgi:hypothetical protein
VRAFYLDKVRHISSFEYLIHADLSRLPCFKIVGDEVILHISQLLNLRFTTQEK